MRIDVHTEPSGIRGRSPRLGESLRMSYKSSIVTMVSLNGSYFGIDGKLTLAFAFSRTEEASLTMSSNAAVDCARARRNSRRVCCKIGSSSR